MNTVFISEIDSYLLDTINVQGYVPSNPSWVLERVPVSYHIPESGVLPDFEHSLVTFHQYDMLLDTQRLQSDLDIIVGTDDAANTISTKKVPVPMKIFYQIDLWSLKQTSMTRMVTDFMKQFPPRKSIFVPSESGIEHDLFMEMTSSRNADGRLWDDAQKKAEERFFRRIFRFCIYAELDSEDVRVHKRVLEVNIPEPEPFLD